MSSETRVIRPFKSFDRFESLLREHAVIKATDGSEPALAGDTLVVDSSSFISTGITLTMAPDRESLQELRQTFKEERNRVFGAKVSLSLVVVLSTPRLRFADVVIRRPLNEASSIPQHLDIADQGMSGTRPRALRTPRGGCLVDVMIVVDDELEPGPLLPWRKGSWLARVKFNVRSQIHDAGFQPLPLDDAARERLQIGGRVQRFVTLRDGVQSVARATTLDSVLEYYVDESTLEFITATPRGALETYLQTGFVLDAVTFFVSEVRSDPELDEYEPDGWNETTVGVLARLASGSRNPSNDDLEDMVELIRSKPYTFIAALEEAWNTRGVAAEVLGGQR